MGNVKVTGSGGRELAYSARIDVSQALKDAERLKKAINDIPAVGSGNKSVAQAKQDAQDAINRTKLQILELKKQQADALAAAAKEKAAQASLNTQLKENLLARQAEAAATKAQIALEKERAAQAAKMPRPLISETSPANIDPIGQTTGSLDTSRSIEQLEAEMAALQAAKAEILSFYEAGTVGAETYNGAITALSAKERELASAIQNYGASSALSAESSAAATAAVETERGAIEGLKLALKELNAQKLLANESNLPVLNREIQEVEREITRLGNIGRSGFDSMGNAIARTGQAAARTLIRLVDRARAKTKDDGGFGNVTFNLRGSIGGVIMAGGEIVETYFPSLGKGEEGVQKGIDFATDTAHLINDGEIILVFVAGMDYASIVEGRDDTDVISGSSKFIDKFFKEELAK